MSAVTAALVKVKKPRTDRTTITGLDISVPRVASVMRNNHIAKTYAASAPIIMTCAVQAFMHQLTGESITVTEHAGKRRVLPIHVKQAVAESPDLRSIVKGEIVVLAEPSRRKKTHTAKKLKRTKAEAVPVESSSDDHSEVAGEESAASESEAEEEEA